MLFLTLLFIAFTNLKSFNANFIAKTLYLYYKSSHIYVIFI